MVTNSRAVVLREFDAPLEITEIEVPNPGEMSAVVDVDYAGICGTDIHLQSGRLPIPTPVVLGHEAVGRVAILGVACGPDLEAAR